MNDVQELIDKGDVLALGKYILTPVAETIEYESTAGKLFTIGKCSENATELNISVPLNLYYLDNDKLVLEQDRLRQRLAYLCDTTALRVLRREPILCKTYEEAFIGILEVFDQKRIVCSNVLISRGLAESKLTQLFADEVDFIGLRELIMAGFVGTLRDAALVTSAKTCAYDAIDANKLVGVDITKCIMEITSPFECVKDPSNAYGILVQGTVKFEVTDPDAVVWATVFGNK